MNDGSIYDEDYFIRGQESGKSLYSNYRYLPSLTIPMAHTMATYLGITREQTILDYGCARGYVVKAFRELGYEAFGIDVSKWAIDNCDEAVKQYVTRVVPPDRPMEKSVDWVIAKDVLEHVDELPSTVRTLKDAARFGLFVVVPLSRIDHEAYIVPEYEKDVTHIHRLTLATWARMFMEPGWRVEASYRLKGVKDNYSTWENGNGFVIARRI